MPSLSWVLALAVVAPVAAQDASLQTWELALIIGGGVVTALLVSYALYLCFCRSPPAKKASKEKPKDVEMGKYPVVPKPAPAKPKAPGKPEAPLSIPDGIGKGKAGVYAKDPPKPKGPVAAIASGTAAAGSAVVNVVGKAGGTAASAAVNGGKAAVNGGKAAVNGGKAVVESTKNVAKKVATNTAKVAKNGIVAAVGGEPDAPAPAAS